MLTLSQRLIEAEAAFHRLSTGSAVVKVRDSNGESVEYGAADQLALSRYVTDLKRQIGGIGQPKTILFHTSKGV